MPRQGDLFDTLSFSVPSRGIWLYRKEGVSDNEVKRVLKEIPLSYGPDCMVYTDDPDSLGAWLRLKDTVETYEGGLLILSSLKDIGRTIGGVADEVSWIIEKGLEVIIMDCPATNIFEKPQVNGMVFKIVAEVWDNLMRTFDNPKGKKPYYPEGWDVMYRDWKAGKIKTKDMVGWSDMSPSTLNSRLQSYASIAEGSVKILPLRKNQNKYEYY